jgi:signal transduction histidine kinase
VAESGDHEDGRGRVETEAEVVDSRGAVIPVQVSTAALESRAGRAPGSVWVLRDISRQRRLEREVVETCERERLRIGRDLHDELGQALTGVSFAGKALEQRAAAGKRVDAEELATIRRLVDEAGGMVRRLSRGLSPVGAGQEGLAEALQELCTATEKMFGVACRLDCSLPVSPGGQVAADHLYRIAQEAVTNAVRHGEPTRIDVRLCPRDEWVELCVADDGRGIGYEGTKEGGMGMRIMRYRAQLLGGRLTIACRQEGGTVLRCIAPGGRAQGGGDG